MAEKAKKPIIKNAVKSSKVKIIRALFNAENIVSASKEANDLYSKSLFGEYIDKRIEYSYSEALYLVKKGKLNIYVGSMTK